MTGSETHTKPQITRLDGRKTDRIQGSIPQIPRINPWSERLSKIRRPPLQQMLIDAAIRTHFRLLPRAHGGLQIRIDQIVSRIYYHAEERQGVGKEFLAVLHGTAHVKHDVTDEVVQHGEGRLLWEARDEAQEPPQDGEHLLLLIPRQTLQQVAQEQRRVLHQARMHHLSIPATQPDPALNSFQNNHLQISQDFQRFEIRKGSPRSSLLDIKDSKS